MLVICEYVFLRHSVYVHQTLKGEMTQPKNYSEDEYSTTTTTLYVHCGVLYGPQLQ